MPVASITIGARMGPNPFGVEKKEDGRVVATMKAPKKARPPSHPPPPFLLLLEKAVQAVEAKKKEQDDKDKKEKAILMEINRIKAKVDDVLVKEELIKLRKWIIKEAMTGRGHARRVLRVELPLGG